jgi:prepilin-type N-terminal cleavage/methylation domain-containing protein
MRTKGFTLIELLVVVSIISLISSVVMSSLGNARDNARLASGKQYDSHLKRAFGADAALIWDFDESSGNVVDLSGNGNTGTLIGATRSSDTVYSRGSSISLSGSTQYVTAPDSSSLNVTGQITIAAWIKPTVIGGDYKVIMAKRVNTNPTSYELYLGNSDGVLSYYNGTQYRSTYVPKTNVWTHVAATLNASGRLILYADGKQVYTATGVTGPSSTVGAFSVGTAGSYISEFFAGYIDDVRVYTQAVTAMEIRSIYAEGLKNIKLARNP